MYTRNKMMTTQSIICDSNMHLRTRKGSLIRDAKKPSCGIAFLQQ